MGDNSGQSTSKSITLLEYKSESAENLLEEQKEGRDQTIDEGKVHFEYTNLTMEDQRNQIGHSTEQFKVPNTTSNNDDSKQIDYTIDQCELSNTTYESETEPYEWRYVYEQKRASKLVPIMLIQTQWFTAIPDDLGENWLIKCVPEGNRVLLVVTPRHVICYNFKGQPIATFPTSFCMIGKYTTILDAIYHKQTKTIFVLDCLIWNSMDTVDVEARHRFSWLKNEFLTNEQLSSCKKFNFVLLDYMPAEKSLIQDAMNKTLNVKGNRYYYEGVTFYEKSSLYEESDLVGWLASFMLKELLHIDVSPEHLVKLPADYKSAKDYIENRELQKLVKKRKFRKKKLAKKFVVQPNYVQNLPINNTGKKNRCQKKMTMVEFNNYYYSGYEKVDVPIDTEVEINNWPIVKTDMFKVVQNSFANSKIKVDVPKDTKVKVADPGPLNIQIAASKPGNFMVEVDERAEGETGISKHTKVELDISDKAKEENPVSESNEYEKNVPDDTKVAADVLEKTKEEIPASGGKKVQDIKVEVDTTVKTKVETEVSGEKNLAETEIKQNSTCVFM